MSIKKSILTSLFFLIILQLNAQNELLQSGPMVGYSEMREVMLWVQTKKAAEVKINYTNKADKKDTHWTQTVSTEKNSAFTAHLIADELLPGQSYTYDVFINSKKLILPYKTEFQTLPLWKWRTDPPAFSFLTGSGAYINEPEYDRPGAGYGGDYQIFEHMAKIPSAFMLWLGDNVYYREPDWHTKTGMLYRYTHTRSTPEMQALLASKHNYAIWDDHDYGPNDSDAGYPFKNQSLDVFQNFWANPTYGIGDMKGAISFFNWNDCDFFLLDNRWYRTNNDRTDCEKTILGKEQLEWLKNALAYSQANFKFIVIGNQFLNTSGLFEMHSNYGYNAERQELIEYIQSQNIYNVIFLTGDRHHSEVSKLERVGKPTIYDITTSPLTSGPAGIWKEEVNALRIDGSFFNQRNFAKLDVSGTNAERKIDMRFFDSNGKELYHYEIFKQKPTK